MGVISVYGVKLRADYAWRNHTLPTFCFALNSIPGRHQVLCSIRDLLLWTLLLVNRLSILGEHQAAEHSRVDILLQLQHRIDPLGALALTQDERLESVVLLRLRLCLITLVNGHLDLTPPPLLVPLVCVHDLALQVAGELDS